MLGVSTSVYASNSPPIGPAGLFAMAEPGVWYDPSDLTTLYQDTAARVPVTAVGQTVALMLDKSRGLMLGSELAVNGDFSDGLTGWSPGVESVLSVVGGQLVVTDEGTDSTSARAYQIIPTVAGRTYTVSVDVLADVGRGQVAVNGSNFNIGGSIVTVQPVGTGSMTNVTLSFLAVSTTSYLILDTRSPSLTASVVIFDNVSVRELPGAHAVQATTTARPIYQVDGEGRGYLSFDGVDDAMLSPVVTPGTDKTQVFAGVRKLSDAAVSVILEHSAGSAFNDGRFSLASTTNPAWQFLSEGTEPASAALVATAAPYTAVLTGLGDISADSSILRVNGSQSNQSSVEQGSGNYLPYSLYIGRRGGASFPFSGNIYGVVVRFGANLDAGVVAATESWMNQKTGAY